MEVIRWVARFGFERQKKHESGPGGGSFLRPRLWGRPLLLCCVEAKREKASAWEVVEAAGADRFLLKVKGEAVVPGGYCDGCAF